MRSTSCFIFIAVPFSSVNPGAFPEEVKSVQTTIKLIEVARYQLRCSRPWQHILHWPCRTLCLVLPVKIQFRTGSHWPGCCLSLFWAPLIETLTQTLTGLITMLVKAPRCGSDTKHDGLAGPYPSAPGPSSHDSIFFILLLHKILFIFNHDLRLFITC